MASPTQPRRPGRCMSGKADSASAIHSGRSATMSAEMPDGTLCSARKVKYWPPDDQQDADDGRDSEVSQG